MLDISPVLLISSGCIFLLVVAVLNKFLFKPLLKHMDERADSIKKDLENANFNTSDVDGLLAEANNIISKAKKEANIIREQAYMDGKENADAILVKAKLDIEEKTVEFSKNLENETKVLKESLMQSMPQFKTSLDAKLKTI